MGGISLSRQGLAIGKERVFDLFPILKERRSQLAGSLSGGERQLLATAPRHDAEPETLVSRRALCRPFAQDG